MENCTIGRAMTILGERWTVVVLREVFSGVRRFDDMRERTGIPRQVLTNRLATLVDQGILRRVPYQEPGARFRDEYRLTPKGFDLYPVLVAVREWGDRYLADPEGPPLATVHRECGAPVRIQLRCDAGHDLESPREVVPRPGPGARYRTAQL
jgi:DNA-binding HxlR family transcriptional regulator